MDPSAFCEMVVLWDLYGQNIQDHIFYLIRTYVYYLHRERHILLGTWNDMAPFGQQKRAKKGQKSKSNANSSSVTPVTPHDSADPHHVPPSGLDGHQQQWADHHHVPPPASVPRALTVHTHDEPEIVEQARTSMS